jgi:hypothetical protein
MPGSRTPLDVRSVLDMLTLLAGPVTLKRRPRNTRLDTGHREIITLGTKFGIGLYRPAKRRR